MEDKIIMYDSPEAAEPITISGWTSKGKEGGWFFKDEHSARWRGCTHLKCDCGGIREKHYTVCLDCRIKSAAERYNALPFKEWDGKEPVCDKGGDTYFFDIDLLNDHMIDEELKEIELLICEPIYYHPISFDSVGADEAHENWEPETRLEKMVDEFNDKLKELSPHSWKPGKTRTTYKLTH